MKPHQALVGWIVFASSIVGVYYFVKSTMPDQPSYPKEYEGGLERELGGPGAERVSPIRSRSSWSSSREGTSYRELS